MLTLVISLIAAQGGDGCQYKSFEGTCTLSRVIEGDTSLEPVYTVTDKSGKQLAPEGMWNGRVSRSMSVKPDEKAALLKHLNANPKVPCTGEYELKGSCVPSRVDLQLPPLAPAPAKKDGGR
jgi:hypothetical protein